MATHPITYYCDSPATSILSEKYGAMLQEKLTAQDKLDALWVILTSIGFSETKGELVTLQATQDEWGALLPDAPNSEEFLNVLDSVNPGIPELLGIAHILALHLYEGSYIDG